MAPFPLPMSRRPSASDISPIAGAGYRVGKQPFAKGTQTKRSVENFLPILRR